MAYLVDSSQFAPEHIRPIPYEVDVEAEYEKDGKLNIMDLPEDILIKILGYTDLNFLRYVAPKVSKSIKALAHHPHLWLDCTLTYLQHDIWEDREALEFVNNLMSTPYINHLTVDVSQDDREDQVVQMALANSTCKIKKLSLHVLDYGYMSLMLLQRHPEIVELELSDCADPNDMYSEGVSATVGAMIPVLRYLDLSESQLLWYPETGKLLTSASPGQTQGDEEEPNIKFPSWFPANHCHMIPEAVDAQYLSPPVLKLDLRHVDNEVEKDKAFKWLRSETSVGLTHFRYHPRHTDADIFASGSVGKVVAQNLCNIINTAKSSLKIITLRSTFCEEEIYAAIAKCTLLVSLHLTINRHSAGEAVCEMFEKLAAKNTGKNLNLISLSIGNSESVVALARVLETLGRLQERYPHLENLELRSPVPMVPFVNLFPGFRPFESLLVGVAGCHEPPVLKQIRLLNIGYVGRRELLQLKEMALNPIPRSLSLRVLDIHDCPCSEDRSYNQCRDRADLELQEVLPLVVVNCENNDLGTMNELYDVGYMPVYTCDCVQSTQAGHRRQTQARHFGGRP